MKSEFSKGFHPFQGSIMIGRIRNSKLIDYLWYMVYDMINILYSIQSYYSLVDCSDNYEYSDVECVYSSI